MTAFYIDTITIFNREVLLFKAMIPMNNVALVH